MIQDYYNYICELVGIGDESNYSCLARKLMSMQFNYTIPNDANRESDGIDLRYRFGYEHDIPYPIIASRLDTFECTILEMLIALSVRVDNIMSSDDNPSFIFWSMIGNLGLSQMTDDNFDEWHVEECIFRFLNREYQPNGEGGLVTLKNAPEDLRNVEIWYQLSWWLDEL